MRENDISQSIVVHLNTSLSYPAHSRHSGSSFPSSATISLQCRNGLIAALKFLSSLRMEFSLIEKTESPHCADQETQEQLQLKDCFLVLKY